MIDPKDGSDLPDASGSNTATLDEIEDSPRSSEGTASLDDIAGSKEQ